MKDKKEKSLSQSPFIISNNCSVCRALFNQNQGPFTSFCLKIVKNCNLRKLMNIVYSSLRKDDTNCDILF
jgi:hypothetical protein